MDHNRPRKGRIHCLDLFEELKHSDGGERNTEVRPAGKVKLSDQTRRLGGLAGLLHSKQSFTSFMNNIISAINIKLIGSLNIHIVHRTFE